MPGEAGQLGRQAPTCKPSPGGELTAAGLQHPEDPPTTQLGQRWGALVLCPGHRAQHLPCLLFFCHPEKQGPFHPGEAPELQVPMTCPRSHSPPVDLPLGNMLRPLEGAGCAGWCCRAYPQGLQFEHPCSSLPKWKFMPPRGMQRGGRPPKGLQGLSLTCSRGGKTPQGEVTFPTP